MGRWRPQAGHIQLIHFWREIDGRTVQALGRGQAHEIDREFARLPDIDLLTNRIAKCLARPSMMSFFMADETEGTIRQLKRN